MAPSRKPAFLEQELEPAPSRPRSPKTRGIRGAPRVLKPRVAR